jgi:hypothetical protein
MTEWVFVSQHAARRWHARAAPSDPPYGPRAAYIEGERVPEPTGLEADEVRYHPPTDALLLRKNNVLVTVIRGREASSYPLREAVRQAGGEPA